MNPETPSDMPIIYETNKEQYGGILWVNIKPQATIPQTNSRCINNMYVIDTDIPLDALDEDIIKEQHQYHKDKETYNHTNTSRFEEYNYSEDMLRFAEKSRQKNHGYLMQIQGIYGISNINYLYVSYYMSKFDYVMNTTTNSQGNLYMDE